MMLGKKFKLVDTYKSALWHFIEVPVCPTHMKMIDCACSARTLAHYSLDNGISQREIRGRRIHVLVRAKEKIRGGA